MTLQTLQIEVTAEDAALLSEAYDFAQFNSLGLPTSVEAALIRVIEKLEEVNRLQKPKDEVRVLRIIEYRGPRSWVEKTLCTSIQGVKEVSPGKTITVTTLGNFPEILEAKHD